MASKNFLSTLARKIKENKGSIAICSILFIIPLFVFPTYPKTNGSTKYINTSQNYACDYWYERAITVFYDSYSLYITIVMFIVGCVICYFY